MNIARFTDYLIKLEKENSRNELTQILVSLLKEASVEEIPFVCYLVLGNLGPSYSRVQFNLAEKLMVKVIARAYGREEKKLTIEYKNLGDLGELAEKLAPKGKGKGMTVLVLYNRLLEIAQEKGTGSVEKKISKMATLLGDLSPKSARFIARMPVGKLRLGFSELTILDTLSFVLSGDKSKRSQVEKAYNVRADIGYIAKLVKEKGIKGLTKINVALGTPIMPALCQRLASPEEMIKKMGKVAVEPKYDGQRCIGGYTGIYVCFKGFVPVRDIKLGDMVLTHKGRFKPVVAVNKRTIEKSEKVFSFQTFLGESFKITEGHRLLVFQKGRTIWRPVERIERGDWLAFPRPNLKNLLKEPRFLDFIDDAGYKKRINLNTEFYRFLGFWAGDGYTNIHHGNKRVGISFNLVKEKKLAGEYQKIIKKVLKIEKISKEERGGVINLYWRDGLFQRWLCKEFRVKQHGKTIPSWFVNISPSCFEAFLRGWIEADGTSRHSGGIRVTTKERELASLAQLIGLQFGKIIGLRKERVKIPKRDYFLTYYNLIFPGTRRYAHWHKNTLLVKVLRRKAILKPDPRMVVYNLQVADDESYLTSLAALHNCQIHADLSNKKGVRRIFTRNLEDVTHMFPDLIGALSKEVRIKRLVLDGEAIGFNPKTGKFLPFQETIKRKRKYDIGAKIKEIPLKLFCFDLLYLDGKDLLQTPFRERRKLLQRILPSKNEKILLSPQILTESPEVLRAYHDKQIKAGLEGVVVKKWESAYEPGRRGWTWVKFKQEDTKKGGGLADTIDCVVMGYYKGKGKRADFGIGAFLVGIRKNDLFLTVSKIGTGLSDEQWREMEKRCLANKAKEMPKQYKVHKNLAPDVWCEPSLVVEIQADNITKSPTHTASYAFRFPRLVRFRDDRSPEEATDLEELERLYKLQG